MRVCASVQSVASDPQVAARYVQEISVQGRKTNHLELFARPGTIVQASSAGSAWSRHRVRGERCGPGSPETGCPGLRWGRAERTAEEQHIGEAGWSEQMTLVDGGGGSPVLRMRGPGREDTGLPISRESREPRAESREPRAESREPRAESREPRAESREPRAESREPRAESREPRAESREPRAESRGYPHVRRGA